MKKNKTMCYTNHQMICHDLNCHRKAIYGTEYKVALHCSVHRQSEEVNVVSRRCKNDQCIKQPLFGKEMSKNAEYCYEHAPSGYVNVKSKKCKTIGCNIIATFGEINSNKSEYCKLHCPIGYVNVKNKTCIQNGCRTRPYFGSPISKIPKYCKDHAPNGYIDVINKKCKFNNCTSFPSFGKKGSKVREYCKKHAPNDYTNIANSTCIFLNCKTRPCFGKKGTNRAEYCKSHAPSTYVDVKSVICKDDNCKTRASFGKVGSKVREYCKTHAPKDYISLNDKNRKCFHEGCAKRRSYTKIGTNLPEYCGEHAPYDYVLHDSGSKCKEKGCFKRSTFGKQKDSSKPEYCSKHAPSNYCDVKHKRCSSEKCEIIASFGMPGYAPNYCQEHKTPEMVLNSRKRKRTIDATCDYCCSKIHYSETFCSECKQYVNNRKTVKRQRKEDVIKELLMETNIINFKHDVKVEYGCSKRRPDFEITTCWGIIILEIDEYQHNRKTYPCECEIMRMKQIYFDCGVEHLLFIRYNPDTYVSLDYISKPEKPKQRHELLVKFLLKHLIIRNFEHLGVVYLYYDGFSRNGIEIETIDPYK